MANDFMIQMTQADFDVELLAASEDSALFGALREGGNQTVSTPNGPWMSHVMGVWHFVAVTGGGNFLQTRQWHIPRYEMAREMEQRKKAFDQFGNRSSSPIVGDIAGLHMRMASPTELAIHLPGGVILTVDPAFTQKLHSDIGLLEKARADVRERAGEFFIPDLKTAADNPVESPSQSLLAAIAMEKLMVPEMEAGNFGVYSAYCTYRDFDDPVQMSDELIRELTETQLAYDPESISDDICDMFADVQKKLLSEPIWGKGVRMSVDQAAPILAAGMAKLTRAQRTQFILMNGMHGAGLFLPLAAVLDVCSFEQYGDYMCQGMAPDSPEEQERRIETAYIALFGELSSV
jgi:hypothetical protein